MAIYSYYINSFYEENCVAISSSNRSFRYGDGLFETIRAFEGTIPFLSFHFARLQHGLQVLDLALEQTFDEMEAIFYELLQKSNLKNARIRLMVFRSGEGLYAPQSTTAHIFVELKPLEQSFFSLPSEGLKLGVFADIAKVKSSISMLKTNNALPYILAANFAQKKGFDECVLLNQNRQLADTIYSNIFVCKEDCIFVPPIADGGVAGTMQAIILQLAAQKKWKVQEVSLTQADILVADEVFLSNAIRGVQWVHSFEGKTYDNKWSVHITQLLNELIANHIMEVKNLKI